MKRLPDWPQRLELFLEQRKHVPFRWGRNDCCTFAADAIQAMTGVDVAAGFRSAYRTELGAARHLLKEGSLEALAARVAHTFGIPGCAPRLAGRGDVVLVRSERDALGVVGLSGDEVWHVTLAGLSLAPMKMCVSAWRI